MKTVLEVLKLSDEYLRKHGIERSRRQAEELLCDALKLSRLQLYALFDRPVSDPELDLCRSYLARRGKGEPQAYISGHVEFFGCSIKVTPAVLIPRQETEILVSRVAEMLSQQELTGKTLVDLCCGSGYIGISLKKKFPELRVILTDLSQDALECARENASNNEVEVELRQGDLLQPFSGERAHYLVCNPPYVSEQEYEVLDREVRDYEPRLALVSGPTGLEFYQRLAHELPGYLAENAHVWFELGTGQGPAVRDLFSAASWKEVAVAKDWAGHDRFFSARFRKE